ncbi:MAG: VCBS repeat-containing protein [Planctomycetes bacterium]|nr:VCBS repeat-containing protein [Planctomycetota bacterium]
MKPAILPSPTTPTGRSRHRAARLAVVLALCSSPAFAQLQFEELRRQHLPVGPDLRSQDLAIGDVDGDQDLDVVFGSMALYRNEGHGVFTDVTATSLPPQSAHDGDRPVFGDVDNDGDLDLVLAVRGQRNRLFLNDGAGVFTDATTTHLPPDADGTVAVALGDIDGDADLDIVFGNGGLQQNRVYRNDGPGPLAGTFTDVTANSLPLDAEPTADVVLGDVDNDGDLDLVVGNGAWNAVSHPDQLYLNDGSGIFTCVTPSQMPSIPAQATTSLELGDVDGDGYLDLFLDNGVVDLLFLNGGAANPGHYADVSSTHLPMNAGWTGDFSLGDVDGDGDLDAVLRGTDQFRLYRNVSVR